MRKFSILVLIIGVVFALSACGASEESIATAIAETQLASNTDTPIPPTNTPVPTDTPTPEPTPTHTPTSTPDTRVIINDPQDMLMEVEDLPTEGKYYLPNSGWISPHRNSEVVSGWGVEEGRAYLEETGRVDGWWVTYARGTRTVNMPEEVYDNVVMYETTDGTQITFDKYSEWAEYDFVEKDIDVVIGDATTYWLRKEMQPSGKNRVNYTLAFIYRNYWHRLDGWGWEGEVDFEFMQEVANTLLEKLKEAELSE